MLAADKDSWFILYKSAATWKEKKESEENENAAFHKIKTCKKLSKHQNIHVWGKGSKNCIHCICMHACMQRMKGEEENLYDE